MNENTLDEHIFCSKINVMFGKRRKAPSVKIPSAVLKREAERAAQKILAAERKKDRNKEIKERAKNRATKKISKQKNDVRDWELFFDDHLRREFWGVLWIAFAIILLTVFWSSAEFSEKISDVFRFLFGRGMWLVPLFAASFGIVFLTRRETVFPPARIVSFLFFFVSILGIFHLFVPHADSFAIKEKFGGALGFTIDFFPREFLGDGVSIVLLLALFWGSAILSFGIKISRIFSKSNEKTPIKTGTVIHKLPAKHFQNELEIVDSTGVLTHKNGAPVKKSQKISLEEEDSLSAAKNKRITGKWEPPDLEILKQVNSTIVVDEKKLRTSANLIREKLEQFGIDVTMKSVHVGPTVTQFTLEPAPGVKLTKITALKNDLALTLAAESVRIEAPIRGKSLVGIEIPNEERAIVGMREILESEEWTKMKKGSGLRLAVGRDVSGLPIVANLEKMPHLLIAGKTGSGKSVAMNAFLCSLLWQNSPENLRMILVDPKRVELNLYNNLPHLLTPVIVEPEKCVSALAWAVAEMNRRYRAFSEVKCRNLGEFNEKFPEKKEPYIVIVIDELADLMMVAGKDVEAAICRIAQMARAVGMHLVVATQRPSVDVVTGLIKANLPSRIAFKVSSGIDSRTILDQIGAEDLLGFGDMLYLNGNSGSITRIQGILLTNEEVERITNHIKLQFPEMVANDEITSQSIEGMAKGGVLTAGTDKEISDEKLDARFNEAVALVRQTGSASASFLQRQLEMGYARSARLLDQMESKGIIGPAKGAKKREVY